MAIFDTDREFSANFDRQASATNSFSFLGLSPPKASKTVSFFVWFHRGATQSGILFLVSIERGTSRRVYHRRPWLSDMSRLGGAPRRFLARPGCGTRRCVGPKRASFWAIQRMTRLALGPGKRHYGVRNWRWLGRPPDDDFDEVQR